MALFAPAVPSLQALLSAPAFAQTVALQSRDRLYLTCAALHALGLAMVALVLETTPLPMGAMHTVGALMAIGFGNLAVALGSRAADPFVRFRLSLIGAVLGAAGAASLAILVVGDG